jgi:hypothetical protein
MKRWLKNMRFTTFAGATTFIILSRGECHGFYGSTDTLPIVNVIQL